MSNYLTARQVEEEYQIDARKLHEWRTKGVPAFEMLQGGQGKRLHARKNQAGEFVYRRAELEEILARERRAEAGDQIDIGGQSWVRDALCRRDPWSFTQTTLSLWALKGCHWLGGRCLRRRRVLTTKGRRWQWYYLEADLDAIREARAAAGQSTTFLTGARVKAEFGFGLHLLRKWTREGCVHLGGRKLGRRLGHILNHETGRSRPVWEYAVDDLHVIQESRARPADDSRTGWITTQAAAELTGLSLSSLSRAAERGRLGGERLRCRRDAGRSKDGRELAEVLYFRREDVERLARRLRVDHRAPHHDAEGCWLPLEEAARQCGVNPQQLDYWRNRPEVPEVAGPNAVARRPGRPSSGLRLRAKKITRHGRKIANGELWVVHFGDRRHPQRGPGAHQRESDQEADRGPAEGPQAGRGPSLATHPRSGQAERRARRVDAPGVVQRPHGEGDLWGTKPAH
jgi:hypothetical protein